MPLVSYSDGGYIQSGGDYWFIVGPCPDTTDDNTEDNQEMRVKVGFHRQGDIMNNEEFQLNPTKNTEDLLNAMSHVRFVRNMKNL